MSHIDSGTTPSIEELGSIRSATKSAMICDFIVLHFSKSMIYSNNSIAPFADSSGAVSVAKDSIQRLIG
jgi:hypothetical protein